MCGICGIIGLDGQPVKANDILSMMSVMKHRGPDDEGIYIDNNIGLGHVRLSVIDLSDAGHQPMFSSDKRFVIVYNGEIYNYLELKKELEPFFQFQTKTDTEVLLNAYIKWGENCLEKLNGMFAFVIFDRKEKNLFAARDRFGIKPFYYYLDDDQFIFASEIPAILTALDKAKIKPDHQTVFDFLVFNRTDQTQNTFFKPIKKLQHGSQLRFKNGVIGFKKWYNLRDKLIKPFSNPEEFRELLSSSISLRLRSDVPVGVSLSGGLDSSSILSLILHDHNRDDINTFSAVYGKGRIGDETPFIEEYNHFLHNMHFVTPTEDSLYSDISNFIFTHAEPFPTTSIYAHYKVMEFASKYVIVILDGQGADEQLGGYHYFFGHYFKNLLFKIKLSKFKSEVYHYWRNHHSLYAFKTLLFFLLPQYLKTKSRVYQYGYLSKKFENDFNSESSIAENIYESSELNQSLINHFEYKLEHLLKWQDRNSMRFGLESRVPFLDHRLVEQTLATDHKWIINKGQTKYILRESLNGILPDKIRERQDKIGFLTPQYHWFRTPNFKSFILDILNSKSFASRGYIDTKKAKNLYIEYLNGKLDISKEIWKWINLELWFQKFIDSQMN